VTTDYLSHIIWPVYPEIGDYLGIEGSYHWRVGRRHADLSEFIELCFASWDKIKLRKQKTLFIPTLTDQEIELFESLVKE
jgi:hypothetical protein